MKNYRTLNEICDEIAHCELGDVFSHPIFEAKSNLRGCFDPLSWEWGNLSYTSKIITIRMFLDYISFEELVVAYKMSERREYVLRELPNAIDYLSEYIPEVAKYAQGHAVQDDMGFGISLSDRQILAKANEIADKYIPQID